jgi:hypothetical protein
MIMSEERFNKLLNVIHRGLKFVLALLEREFAELPKTGGLHKKEQE